MRVDRLALEDFRNYERAELQLDPGVNLVVGRNAQGKTNLLEAVHCLSGLGSPRGNDAALVREGAERALLHAEIARSQRKLRVDLEIRPGRGTRALINGTPATAGRALARLSASVFFGPDELSLVKGSPEGRRKFLDDLVVEIRPARDGLRREWERVLKQRNALLRSAPRGSSSGLPTLEVWDEQMCRAGAALAAARLEALGSLLPYARKRYEAVAGEGGLELSYMSTWIEEDFVAAALVDPADVDANALAGMLERAIESVRVRELERGTSLVGPQRDDVGVLIESGPAASLLDARTYASQGDQRTAALALKLAEHDLLCAALGEEPVLLLDDVFSELDPSRRSWLGDAVRSMGQVVLSSAEPGAAESARAALVLTVTEGRVEAGHA